MRKRLILTGLAVVALIILGLLISAYYSNKPAPSASVNGSSSSSAVAPPTFTGEDAFTNIGMTSDQVSNLEQTLEQYLSSAGKTPSSVGFSGLQKISMNKNAATPIWTIAFAIQLNNKGAYQATMDYFNLTGIRLYLYSLGSNKLLYDSQDVGGSPGP